MKKHLVFAFVMAVSCFLPVSATAAQTSVYVADFSVFGASNPDDLKRTLPGLLASRLSGDDLVVVDKVSDAAVVVVGSYTIIGGSFSLDAIARDTAGKVRVRAFAQGRGQEDLIPAMTRLAADLAGRITGKPREIPKEGEAPKEPVKEAAKAAPVEPVVVRPKQGAPEIVAPADIVKSGGSASMSRLPGELGSFAVGRTLPSGERELFVAGRSVLKYYRQGEELRLLREVKVAGNERILSVDTGDLDRDGVPEVYVTIFDGRGLVSQVWGPTEKGLEQKASGLPYYFRSMALDGGDRKIYAQEMSSDEDFYGGVGELAKTGKGYEIVNRFELPRFGNIYNFNRFADASGKKHWIVTNSDGYLIVYGEKGDELWRTGDKFGGSATSFQREDVGSTRAMGDRYRWIFLDQRITVTPAGEIIVPKNWGIFSVGYNRSYGKSSVYCFAWNGTVLDEKWHTKEDQSYLPDYAYDPAKKELLLLEVVKKDGLFSTGASAFVVKKVE
jgi:hypothetical protein